MGADRNAPLPPGAAVPGAKIDSIQLLKRVKSCYDVDIDPLYTAWGVDLYDLFVNTKSDLGNNPYVVDAHAHAEFLALPKSEQARLGYHYQLFQKLQDLVRQGDRVVQRNQEKIRAEQARNNNAHSNKSDVAAPMDATAVEQLARAMWQLDDAHAYLQKLQSELDATVQQQDVLTQQMEPLLQAQQQQTKAKAIAAAAALDGNVDDKKNDDDEAEKTAGAASECKGDDESAAVAGDDDNDGGQRQHNEEAQDEQSKQLDTGIPDAAVAGQQEQQHLRDLQLQLGHIMLQKQQQVYVLHRHVHEVDRVQSMVDQQHRQLVSVNLYDKSVCPVSGNFMSARDADERIAAHYAGRQYQGWKLVRDKLAAMQAEYGRYGPPPPPRKEASAHHTSSPSMSMGGSRGGGGYDRRGGGGGGGPPANDRWERHGPGGGGGYDRGGPPPPRRNWRR